MEKAYVFLADGFEEIEGLTVVDILRRAGADTQTVSVMGRKEITGTECTWRSWPAGRKTCGLLSGIRGSFKGRTGGIYPGCD